MSDDRSILLCHCVTYSIYNCTLGRYAILLAYIDDIYELANE